MAGRRIKNRIINSFCSSLKGLVNQNTIEVAKDHAEIVFKFQPAMIKGCEDIIFITHPPLVYSGSNMSYSKSTKCLLSYFSYFFLVVSDFEFHSSWSSMNNNSFVCPNKMIDCGWYFDLPKIISTSPIKTISPYIPPLHPHFSPDQVYSVQWCVQVYSGSHWWVYMCCYSSVIIWHSNRKVINLMLSSEMTLWMS